MDYRIIEKEPFKAIGKVIKVSTCGGEHHQRISEFWEEAYEDGTCETLSTLGNGENLLGITLNFEEDTEQMSYMIGVENNNNLESNEFDIIEVPYATWAIFTSVGPLPFAIQGVLEKIYQEWFPATGYEQGYAPVLEVYPPGDTCAEDYKCEVWIPIVKR